MDYEISTTLSENIWFLWAGEQTDKDKCILVQTSTNYSPWFLFEGEIFLQLPVAQFFTAKNGDF
jgi:hypothetical protein